MGDIAVQQLRHREARGHHGALRPAVFLHLGLNLRQLGAGLSDATTDPTRAAVYLPTPLDGLPVGPPTDVDPEIPDARAHLLHPWCVEPTELLFSAHRRESVAT